MRKRIISVQIPNAPSTFDWNIEEAQILKPIDSNKNMAFSNAASPITEYGREVNHP